MLETCTSFVAWCTQDRVKRGNADAIIWITVPFVRFSQSSSLVLGLGEGQGLMKPCSEFFGKSIGLS